MNNFEMMRKRLNWQGGIDQEDRMIKDKWRTLQRALKYSYQGCTVQKVQEYSQVLPFDWQDVDPDQSLFPQFRALINPDKVKQDYDDKVISIDYSTGYQPGDVFEWNHTDTYWIIYTQEITEHAYFRGEIRRCRYRIKFKDTEGNWCSTWAAIRGPVETQIDSIQKNQERVDVPNLGLNILMPRNNKTLQAFERYKEFLLEGRCWKVQAPDGISMKNIIEVNAEEDYIEDTDDVENEMKDGLIFERVEPRSNSDINGLGFIKPKVPSTYSIDSKDSGSWYVLDNAPVKLVVNGNNSVELVWNKMVSGQFVLEWRSSTETKTKTIVVESLY